MKYIKLFEEKEKSKYKNDDYVLTNITDDNDGTPIMCKIINTRIIQTEPKKWITHYEAMLDDDNIFYIGDNDIERKLTIKEINEFEIKKTAKKYNLI